MNLILQSNRWDCLPTAFAMCLDVLPIDMYGIIGHDGSEIIWPELEEPYKRRSFSLDEMIDFCLSIGYTPVYIDKEPEYVPIDSDGVTPFKPYSATAARERWNKYLRYYDAVLLGLTKEGKPHAVAWDHNTRTVLDPVGFKYTEQEFNAMSAILIM